MKLYHTTHGCMDVTECNDKSRIRGYSAIGLFLLFAFRHLYIDRYCKCISRVVRHTVKYFSITCFGVAVVRA